MIERLPPHQKSQAAQLVAARHLEVYRNLLFARAVDGFSLEEVAVADSQVPLEPLGIVAISDRIREDVMEAISLFGQKGIELKILS